MFCFVRRLLVSSSPFRIPNRFHRHVHLQALDINAANIILGDYPQIVRECMLNLQNELIKERAEKKIAQEKAEREIAQAKAEKEIAQEQSKAEREIAQEQSKAEREIAQAQSKAEKEVAHAKAEKEIAQAKAEKEIVQAKAEKEIAQAKAEKEIAQVTDKEKAEKDHLVTLQMVEKLSDSKAIMNPRSIIGKCLFHQYLFNSFD